MSKLAEFFENEKPMVGLGITSITALLTGPVFQMDAAAVGSIMGAVAALIFIWVRFNVWSKKGATKVATAAATQAVAAVSGGEAGVPGEVTTAGEVAIQAAVENVLGGDPQIKPPG